MFLLHSRALGAGGIISRMTIGTALFIDVYDGLPQYPQPHRIIGFCNYVPRIMNKICVLAYILMDHTLLRNYASSRSTDIAFSSDSAMVTAFNCNVTLAYHL